MGIKRFAKTAFKSALDSLIHPQVATKLTKPRPEPNAGFPVPGRPPAASGRPMRFRGGPPPLPKRQPPPVPQRPQAPYVTPPYATQGPPPRFIGPSVRAPDSIGQMVGLSSDPVSTVQRLMRQGAHPRHIADQVDVKRLVARPDMPMNRQTFDLGRAAMIDVAATRRAAGRLHELPDVVTSAMMSPRLPAQTPAPGFSDAPPPVYTPPTQPHVADRKSDSYRGPDTHPGLRTQDLPARTASGSSSVYSRAVDEERDTDPRPALPPRPPAPQPMPVLSRKSAGSPFFGSGTSIPRKPLPTPSIPPVPTPTTSRSSTSSSIPSKSGSSIEAGTSSAQSSQTSLSGSASVGPALPPRPHAPDPLKGAEPGIARTPTTPTGRFSANFDQLSNDIEDMLKG